MKRPPSPEPNYSILETWTNPETHSTVTFEIECYWDGETLEFRRVIQTSEGGCAADIPKDVIETLRREQERELLIED